MTLRGVESIPEEGNFRHRRWTGHAYFLLPLFWLMLSAVSFIAFLNMQAQTVERRFDDNAIAVASHFSEVEHGIKLALEGFAAMLRVMNAFDPDDRKLVARYAKQMREVFPQVYMLEQVERVAREQIPEFEKEQDAIQDHPFHIRTFDYGLSRTWLPPQDKENYYVGTFMEPMTPVAAQVLGMDIESSKPQAAALHTAIRSGGNAVSTLFDSVSGYRSYVMIRPVDADRTRFAKVVVRADMFDALPWLEKRRDLSIVIHHDGFEAGDPRGLLYRHLEAPASELETMFLPRFHWQKGFADGDDDPFLVSVAKQMRWRDLDLGFMAAMLTGELVVFLLLLNMARQHYRHDRERRVHESRMVYLARHDNLTGLPNRALLLDRLEQAIHRTKRANGRLALLFLDIDRFKSVNDTYGHDAGDRFLMTMADTLRDAVRAQDTVARLAGDEFVVLLEQVGLLEDVEQVARKIKEQLLSSTCSGYRDLGVGVSIGIALYPEHGTDANTLLRYADGHMYGEKKGGSAPPLML